MSKLPFDLEQLRYFKALANEQNFTKAAKTLYISRSYFSKQIRNLEKKLNVLLITKQNKKIILTKSGGTFLIYSKRILELCEESCRAIVDSQYGDRGLLTIGTSQAIGTYLLPRILEVFSKKNPQIHLESEVNKTTIISKKISNGEIDLAIIVDGISTKLQKNIMAFHFIKDELVIILPRSHFISEKRIVRTQLYCLNFVMLNSDLTNNKLIIQALKHKNINLKKLRVIMEFDSIEAIKTAVSCGLGAAFVSSLSIEKEIKLNKLKFIRLDKINIKRSIYLITSLKHYNYKILQLFYNELLLSYKLCFKRF